MMRVIETTVHIGSDGMLRLEVPVDARDQDVHVAVVVGPASPTASITTAKTPSMSNAAPSKDSWAPLRSRLAGTGLHVPAPGSWTHRQTAPMQFDSPPVAQTLVVNKIR
jgi:hypothetical protein